MQSACRVWCSVARISPTCTWTQGDYYTGIHRPNLIFYLANARELFENGNGLFYGNPFSASSFSPRIFSHLELVGLAAFAGHSPATTPSLASCALSDWIRARLTYVLRLPRLDRSVI